MYTFRNKTENATGFRFGVGKDEGKVYSIRYDDVGCARSGRLVDAGIPIYYNGIERGNRGVRGVWFMLLNYEDKQRMGAGRLRRRRGGTRENAPKPITR